MQYISQEEVRRRLMILFKHSGLTLFKFSKPIGITWTTLNNFIVEPHRRMNPLTLMKIVRFVEKETGEEIMVDISTVEKLRS